MPDPKVVFFLIISIISILFTTPSTTPAHFTFNHHNHHNQPCNSPPRLHHLTYTPTNLSIFAMAATKTTVSVPSFPVPYGRSGYNKDGDDEEDNKLVNQGRSGYNGPAKAEDDDDN